jgi:hypothetical protein
MWNHAYPNASTCKVILGPPFRTLDGPATENPSPAFTALATAWEPHTEQSIGFKANADIRDDRSPLTDMRPAVKSASSFSIELKSGLPSVTWTGGISSSEAARLFTLLSSEPDSIETSSHWRTVKSEFAAVRKILIETWREGGANLRASLSVSDIQRRWSSSLDESMNYADVKDESLLGSRTDQMKRSLVVLLLPEFTLLIKIRKKIASKPSKNSLDGVQEQW